LAGAFERGFDEVETLCDRKQAFENGVEVGREEGMEFGIDGRGFSRRFVLVDDFKTE